jgi:isoquinoline 1-oxidoreductase beta subunit
MVQKGSARHGLLRPVAVGQLWRLIMIHHRPQAFDDGVFRRSYLISSTAVGGSMVLSLNLPLGEGDAGGCEDAAPDVCIGINRAGRIVLTMQRLEVAQDAPVRMLVAEELEVAPKQIDIEYAPAKEIFGADAILPVLPAGNSNGAIRGTLLRKASATARLMLIAAAAGRWSVDARSCHAHEGEVVHAPTWRKLKYGELAIDAAHMPIPTEITLKAPWVEGAWI